MADACEECGHSWQGREARPVRESHKNQETPRFAHRERSSRAALVDGHRVRRHFDGSLSYQWNIRRPASVCAATSTPRPIVVFAALFGTKTISFGSSTGSGAFPEKIFPRLIGVSFRSPLTWSVCIICPL